MRTPGSHSSPWSQALALALLAGACSPPVSTEDAGVVEAKSAEPRIVLTANYPLAYFAERLAGEFAEVSYPGPPDEDPAFWQPDRATLRRLQSADLLLLNGPGYSSWVGALSLSLDRTIETTAGFEDRWIEAEASTVHVHGPEGTDGGAHVDLTTWIDPALAREQAASIAAALIRIDPQHRERYAERLESLESDLADLGSRLKQAVRPETDRHLLASHPVYAYLSRALGLNLRSVHFEPGLDPGAEGWRELDEILETHSAELMVWEGEPLPETVRELGNRGIRCVVFDPCAASPGGEDWLESMQENARRLGEAFSQGH